MNCSERIEKNHNQQKVPTARSVSLEQENDLFYQNDVRLCRLPHCDQNTNEISSSALFSYPKQSCNHPLTRRYNNTYPPFSPLSVREKFQGNSLGSYLFGSSAHCGRWDEDPCLLRPHSPSISCPHDPRSKNHKELDEGSCFVVGSLLDADDSKTSELCFPGDNEYSYAGQDILSPAEVIKAQASLCQDSDSYGGSDGSENIYEEISEGWDSSKMKNKKSLVEEVFDEYERMKIGRLHSTFNQPLVQTSGSIVTLDFTPNDTSASPDSGLTISTSDAYSDNVYDTVCTDVTSIPHLVSKSATVVKRSTSVLRKPPIPKLTRCESFDIKDRTTKHLHINQIKVTEGILSDKIKKYNVKGEGKIENYIRGHLRASGRGLKQKLDGVKEKLEQSKRVIFNIPKKGKYKHKYILYVYVYFLYRYFQSLN